MLDIVIVNWNSGHYLSECLSSIKKYGGDHVRKVAVVDNGSTDSSLESAELSPRVDVLRNTKNFGFAKACNMGASRCGSEYLLFLNPDARLIDDVLAKALLFMESPEAKCVGICGVRLLDEQSKLQRHCARFPTPFTFVGRSLGLDVLAPALFPNHFMREFDHLTSRAVDQVIGAFFLVRRSVFAQLGGFDERFFVYFEDLDFSLRAKLAGWSTWYLAEATAFHKGQGSSENVKAARLFYSISSRLRYAKKHFSGVGFLAVLATSVFAEPVSRLLRAGIRLSRQEAIDTLRGYRMVWGDALSFIVSRGTVFRRPVSL